MEPISFTVEINISDRVNCSAVFEGVRNIAVSVLFCFTSFCLFVFVKILPVLLTQPRAKSTKKKIQQQNLKKTAKLVLKF